MGVERGSWLIRHHRRPRRKTFHPDWKSTEVTILSGTIRSHVLPRIHGGTTQEEEGCLEKH
eukprot:8101063-Prorocentrum_lima.AAC.1